MSNIYKTSESNPPPGPILTLSGENGSPEGPSGGNFNFSGSTAGGSSANGAILFSTTVAGEMNAAVQVDGTTITINGSNELMAVSSLGILSITNINNSDSPYTVLSTDQFIAVDSSGGAVILLLPNSTTTGRVIYVKDTLGDASTNNIDITTVGGAVTIDEVLTYIIASNNGSVSIIFYGSAYGVF